MAGSWTLVRMDIRSTATPGGWPMARVELRHATRGRITDIASREGHLECVLDAIGRIVGLPASVRSLDINYAATEEKQLATATIEVDVEGRRYRGIGKANDVLRSAALAHLEALSLAECETAAG